jgi:type II secretory pathway pseudopilin PulG
MRRTLHRKNLNSESGMTLIELMIASVVLIFGMLSIMGLLMLAIGNNGRSKIDSNATMLTQVVLEQVSAKLAGGGPGSITDNSACGAGPGTTHIINDQAGGATLLGGKIDFTQAQGALVAGNYAMDYIDCNNNITMTYDVRWNVQSVGANGTFLVTVGARPKSSLPVRFGFALPVTMRAYVGGN